MGFDWNEFGFQDIDVPDTPTPAMLRKVENIKKGERVVIGGIEYAAKESLPQYREYKGKRAIFKYLYPTGPKSGLVVLVSVDDGETFSLYKTKGSAADPLSRPLIRKVRLSKESVMDNRRVARQLVRLAKELIASDGYKFDYDISDTEFRKTIHSLAGGYLTKMTDSGNAVHANMPYWEAGHEGSPRNGASIMFLYRHLYPDDETGIPGADFGIWTQFNNKRLNIAKQFSTHGGDDSEKQFKRFQMYVKNTLPKVIQKMVDRGDLVSM